jgi:hypothetical protein
MNTLDYILSRYKLDKKSVIEMDCSRKITLPNIFRSCGFVLGVEVGVERGVYSKVLCERVPNLKLYGVDSWTFYAGYREHVPQERLDEFFLHAKNRLSRFNFQPIKDFSINAVKRFTDESLDFVYIDSNHTYDFIREDIREWSKKVKKDGIVSGHDYGNNRYMDESGCKQIMRVKKAVDEWVIGNKISPLFLLTKGEKYPSWFYVKT